jgi:uncharacterized protein YbjT (DUF2867 family)
MAQKIIAVLGATGAQGGGLVRAILADRGGEFAARALTRNPGSEKARELARLGAEVVAANVDDEDSLAKAFAGTYGAFCVTFFWDHMSPEREIEEAKKMASAAKRAGVQHVIWSTLDDTRKWVPLSDDRMPTLHGNYKVPHFDAKGEANHFFTDAGVPTTFLNTSFFWENFIFFGMGPKKGPDGKLAIVMALGDAKMPGIASGDVGKCALGVFKRGKELIGKTIGIAGDHVSGAEMAAAISRAVGREIAYTPVPPETFRSFGFPGADDLGNMFQFKSEFEKEYRASRPVELARQLNPELQSFSTWAAANASRIPLE